MRPNKSDPLDLFLDIESERSRTPTNNSNYPPISESKGKTSGKSSKQQENFNKIIERFEALEGRLDEISMTISATTSTIQSLRDDIGEISRTLHEIQNQAPRVTELPVFNQDEETISQLEKCGAKILEQLALAARWYAVKKPDIEHMSNFEENLRAQLDKEKAAERQKGREEFVRGLLKKYGDIHKIFTENEVLAAALINAGVKSVYNIDEKIEITQDNIDKFYGLQPDKPGWIRITAPAYTLGNDILQMAKFEEISETEQGAGDTSQEQGESEQKSDEPAQGTGDTSQVYWISWSYYLSQMGGYDYGILCRDRFGDDQQYGFCD